MSKVMKRSLRHHTRRGSHNDEVVRETQAVREKSYNQSPQSQETEPLAAFEHYVASIPSPLYYLDIALEQIARKLGTQVIDE
jgi:hypothetical protein